MASFTDKPQSFNPYISTVPVQAMVAVGMEKERQFKEGIDKAQNYIDSIAGLDIMKDEDKQFVSQKLGEVKEGITKNLSGDFSDDRIVNQIGGAARSIYKNPTVQTAVMSTANYRAQVSELATAKKAGKSDKNNEDYFYNEANKWLTDGKAGTSFNGKYSPYTDIMKTIRENVSAAGLDQKYIEQMFETDSNGNILLDKNIHPIPSKVMTTLDYETNAPKIKAIVANVLAQGDVQNQVHIDGWANYRNIPVEGVLDIFHKDFDARKSYNQQSLISLQALSEGTNLSDMQKEAIEQQKKSIQESISNDEKQFYALQRSALVDPEGFKENYYANNYTNNLLSAFTTTKEKRETKTSPLRQQLNWEADMGFKRDKENFDRKMAQANYGLAVERLNLEYPINPLTGRREKASTKTGKVVKADTVSEINSENSGASIDAAVAYQEGTTQLKTDVYNTGLDLLYTYLHKIHNGLNEDGSQMTIDNAKQMATKFAKANGESVYGFVTRFVSDLQNKAEISGIKLSAGEQAQLNEFKRLNTNVIDRTALTVNGLENIKKETGVDLKTAGLSTVTVKGLHGDNNKSYTITPQDQMDFITYLQGNGFGKNDLQVKESKKAANRLQSKFKDVLFVDLFNKGFGLGGGKLNTLAHDDNFKLAQTKLQDYFSKINPVSDRYSAPLVLSTDEKKEMVGKISPLFNSSRLSEDDQKDFMKALLQSGSSITYDAVRPVTEGQSWTGTIYVTGEDGKQHSIDVSQENLQAITGDKFQPYEENRLQARMNVSKFKSTNMGTWTTDARAYQTAAITSDKFTGLQGSNITAYADVAPVSTGKLSLVIYAKDDKMNAFKRMEFIPTKADGSFFSDPRELEMLIPQMTSTMFKDKFKK